MHDVLVLSIGQDELQSGLKRRGNVNALADGIGCALSELKAVEGNERINNEGVRGRLFGPALPGHRAKLNTSIHSCRSSGQSGLSTVILFQSCLSNVGKVGSCTHAVGGYWNHMVQLTGSSQPDFLDIE